MACTSELHDALVFLFTVKMSPVATIKKKITGKKILLYPAMIRTTHPTMNTSDSVAK